MYLLATDTSGKDGSIALARVDANDECDVVEMVALEGGTFSAQLVPQIAALLRKRNLRTEDLGAFAVVSGPGSFTGLRIGLAAIKGLAEILQKPISAVSLLEVMARTFSGRGRVIAAMDAGRHEFYVGVYESNGTSQVLVSESLLTQAELLHSAADSLLIASDSALAAAARGDRIEVAEVERPRSDAIARLGLEKIRVGQTVAPEVLDANYIRRAVDPVLAKDS
jgi:tRNA threonylcarbamoyladenosine biosynthesis protein TsaB